MQGYLLIKNFRTFFLALLVAACSDGPDTPSADTIGGEVLAGPRGLAQCPDLNPLDPAPLTGPAESLCQDAVASAGRTFLSAVYRAQTTCLARIQRGEILPESNNLILEPSIATCVGMRELSTGLRRPPLDAATAASVDAAEAALAESLQTACTDEAIAMLDLCGSAVDAATQCLAGIHWEYVQHLLEQTHGQITADLGAQALACQDAISSAVDVAVTELQTTTAGCLHDTPTGRGRCLGSFSDGRLQAAEIPEVAAAWEQTLAGMREAVEPVCPVAVLAELDPCAYQPEGLGQCLACVVGREALILTGDQFGGEPRDPAVEFIDWGVLSNPIHALPDGRFKDQAMGYRDGWFYLLVGPVYEDRVENLHYRSRDLKSWEPYVDTMGPDGRFPASINLTRPADADGRWHAVFQTGGPSHPDFSRIYRSTSEDLVNWEPGVEVGPGLLPGESTIDGAIFRKAGYYHVMFKWREPQLPMVTRSLTTELDQNWLPAEQMVLQSPDIVFGVGPGWAENFQILDIDGQIRLVATARDPEGYRCPNQYTCTHEPFIYQMKEGDGTEFSDWLSWDHKRHLRVPYEAWNPEMHANTGFINDWREYDGFFYLTYAGSLDSESFAGRGQGRIGIARSRDLIHWRVAGDLRD